MKKLGVGLIYLLGVVAVLAVFFPACVGPGISVESSIGFTHEVSVRVPFRPPDDSVASLYIDDEGTAIFIKIIEISHRHVHSDHEFWREIYKIDRHGTVESKKFGPFEVTHRLDSKGNCIALENGDNVTYVDVLSLTSRSVVDSDLADIMRNHSADYYDNGVVVYTIPVTEKSGSERGVVVYNTSTYEEIRVDFQEEYASIDTVDFDGENILIEATKSNRKPPVLYVLGLDGEIKVKLDLLDQLGCARLIPGGIAVYMTGVLVVDTDNTTSQISRSSLLKKYRFNGTVEWSHSIPLKGVPHLKLLPSQDNGVLALTLINRNEMTSFIGYFTNEDGEKVYASTFQGEYGIRPLDNSGGYYIYPEWSLYPEIPPPSGRIALFNYGNELASIESDDDIYYFAASPGGKYFAVVSDGTLSIFSTTEARGKEK